jgi:hypothetical protein
MFQAFVFNTVAVTVRHWFQVDREDDEHGTRIEVVRRIRRSHQGSTSTSQPIELNGLIWRADLFDRIGDEPGSMKRAHHHFRFDEAGTSPIGRDWNEELTADPFGWTERKLSDLPALAVAAGVEVSDIDAEAEDLRRALPAIMRAARACAPDLCKSPEQCRLATRDTTEIVRLMTTQFRDDPKDPRLAT